MTEWESDEVSRWNHGRTGCNRSPWNFWCLSMISCTLVYAPLRGCRQIETSAGNFLAMLRAFSHTYEVHRERIMNIKIYHDLWNEGKTGWNRSPWMSFHDAPLSGCRQIGASCYFSKNFAFLISLMHTKFTEKALQSWKNRCLSCSALWKFGTMR